MFVKRWEIVEVYRLVRVWLLEQVFDFAPYVFGDYFWRFISIDRMEPFTCEGVTGHAVPELSVLVEDFSLKGGVIEDLDMAGSGGTSIGRDLVIDI